MLTSPEGIALIQEFEKCALTAYQDGGGVWTIGWGETRNVKPGMVISQAEADDRLKARLIETAAMVTNCTLSRHITQPQFDAFVCFTYNVGTTAFRESTMLKRFLAGVDCTPEFCRWVNDNGKVVPGLVVRRMAERQLFRGRDWRAIQ